MAGPFPCHDDTAYCTYTFLVVYVLSGTAGSATSPFPRGFYAPSFGVQASQRGEVQEACWGHR